ncbi:MAG: AMP-binding protein [Pseudomonadota bacterium]
MTKLKDLHQVVKAWAQCEDVAICQGDVSLRYKDIVALFDYLTGDYFADIKDGSRIALVLPEGVSMATVLMYSFQRYAVLPLTTRYLSEEYASILRDFNIEYVLSSTALAHEELKAACQTVNIPLIVMPPVEAIWTSLKDGTAQPKTNQTKALSDKATGQLLLHTSGTTGKPKRVVLRVEQLMASVEDIQQSYGLTSADRSLTVMPLFHIHGIVAGLLTPLLTGGSLVLLGQGFDVVAFYEALKRYAPTWYSAVPTMHHSIVHYAQARHPAKIAHTLRFIRSSSMALPQVIADGLRQYFAVPVYQAYGMTEAAHQIATQQKDCPNTPASVGYLTGVTVQIRDEATGKPLLAEAKGVIWICSRHVIAHYEGLKPSESGVDSAGFFNTGDIGYLSEAGELFIVSRIKELINKGGEKLSPVEIEEVLLTHPAIDQAVCFALEDAYYGEDVGAAVVLKAGKQASEAAMREYVGYTLSQAKIPRTIYILDQLPKGRTGKLQRIGLEARLKKKIVPN